MTKQFKMKKIALMQIACLLAIISLNAQTKSVIITNKTMETATNKDEGLASFSLYNIAFPVNDMEQSIKWYENTLGFALISRTTFSIPSGSAEIALLEGGGMRLELLSVPEKKRIDDLFADAPKHLNVIGNKAIVLQVNDLAVASKELEEKGVTFVWREQYLAGNAMLCSMIKDIDGNKINIFQTNTIIGNENWDAPIDAGKIAQEHLFVWNNRDSKTRKDAIAAMYSNNIKVTDPYFKINGVENLDEFIEKLQANHLGYAFALEGKPSAHHNIIKFNWSYGPKKDQKRITGTDVVTVNNGKIESLYIFLDHPEPVGK